jgi:hypothetical protein
MQVRRCRCRVGAPRLQVRRCAAAGSLGFASLRVLGRPASLERVERVDRRTAVRLQAA